MDSVQNIEYVPRICLIGANGVGKTSLIKYIKAKYFEKRYIHSQYTVLHPIKISTNMGTFRINIVDTAISRSKSTIIPYPARDYVGVDVGVFMFDLSSKHSFYTVINLIQIFQKARPTAQIIICGNKKDISHNRRINPSMFHRHIPLGVTYLDMSIKTTEGISNLLEIIAKMVKKNENIKITPYFPPGLTVWGRLQ